MLEYNKAKTDWTIRPIYETKDNSYVMDMMSGIMEKRSLETKPLRKVRALEAPVNTAASIARTEKPLKKDAIEQHKSRIW